MSLYRQATGERTPLYSKRGPFFLERGDLVTQYAEGGAGVGNPLERDPELVRRDVLYEYISLQRARDVYKVVIDPSTLEIDQEATRQLRG